MITNAIKFSTVHIEFINLKKQLLSFNHSNWEDEDIVEIKKQIKAHYINEQNNTCPYCQQIIKSENGRLWDIEHIIPRVEAPNFMFEPHNLCVCCPECNNAKSDKRITISQAKKRYPSSSSSYLIIHPHYDEYSDHILVIKAGLYYFPRGNKGEKTIEICKLNRFHKYAGFGEDSDNDDLIFTLSEALKESDNAATQKKLRIKIAELAISGLL